MYFQHFGLREAPFNLTPDTSYFLNRAGYQDGLNVLLVALRSGEGFIKVTGEVGTGKTLLCRQLLNSLENEFRAAYLHNPTMTRKSLLLSVADELDIALPASADTHAVLKALRAEVIHIHAHGRRVVVCIDEAQALPVETLEVLRLLTNLETEKRKLIQVVLFGQPELDQVLSRPSIRQLRQRITFSYELLPMNRVELAAYVAHRLAVAGCVAPELLHPAALNALHRYSRGVPRLINIICNKALLLAWGKGLNQVQRQHVEAAAMDTLDAQTQPLETTVVGRMRAPGWLLSMAGLLTMFAVGAVL